ncbi:tetratricopeptide repeat protein, partial [candidate division WOR-3 bacterium]|nr:tetratricopeptide repeat protein [candidate division WOR-3 bacterium]
MMLPLLFLLAGVLSPEQSRQLAERYNQARALMAGRNYEQAGAALGALVRDFGSSEFGDELRYTLAETRFSLGQYGRAADLFGQLVDRSRQSYIKPEALYGLAISAIMMGDLRRAQQALNKLSQQPGYDRSDRTNLAAGVLHYFQKDYAQAIARLSGVELPEAKYFLGKAYAVTGRPLPALLKFKEVTDSSPGTPLAALAHFAAGQALFTNRDYDGAQAKFRFFVENFPGAPLTDYADYFLGCVLLARKQYAQAIERLTPLTRHSNNLLAAHANYFVGYANMALGQAQAAVERFQRVRSNYPRSK